MEKRSERQSVDSSIEVNLDDAGVADHFNTMPTDGVNIFVSITYLQHRFECFSHWSKQDMKCFWRFVHKLKRHPWKDLLKSGGGADKAGFRLTKICKHQYPSGGYINGLPDDLDFFELRVDGKKRVHGCRVGNIFHICWLDRNHRICS